MEMKYLDLIDEYKEDMIKTLQELVAIKSVASDPVGDVPFGKGVQDAFEYMLKKAKEEALIQKISIIMGGHIEFGGYLFDEEGDMVEPAMKLWGYWRIWTWFRKEKIGITNRTEDSWLATIFTAEEPLTTKARL